VTLSPIQRFRRDGYNDLLTHDLGLTTDSVVLDFGGYVGDYAWAISNRYQCQVHIFEPVPKYANILHDRFVNRNEIHIHEYAVGDDGGLRTFRDSADGTGAFGDGERIHVSFRSAESLLDQMPQKIDLIAVNIEGGEYELLPALGRVGLLARTNQLFVQFHLVGPDPIGHREMCRRLLRETHECRWSYDFVWESWVRR